MRLDPRTVALLLFAGLAIGWGSVLHAQVPPAATEAPAKPATEPPAPQAVPAGTRPTPGPGVEPRQLDTFLLRDSKGNLVPVLGMSFDEFEQLLKLKKGLAPPPPPGFTLDVLSITGTVTKGVADLQITLTVRVRDEGWVGVPLGMKSAVLREQPRYEGPGEHRVRFDEDKGGYEVWLRGAGDKAHVLTMRAACNTSAMGDETRLALPLPRATESSLRLTIPGQRWDAFLSSGEGLISVAPKGGGDTEISVLGPAGDLQLGWRVAREAAIAGPMLLDSAGEIVVKVESENRISSDARLRVRSLGAPLASFQVRLPAGMELVPTSPVGYTISLASGPLEASGDKSLGQFQVVEIRLDRPTTATAEVRLLATTSAAGTAPANLAPARFDVVNAVRQRGTIDFAVEGQWQLSWNDDPTVQRLDIAADAAAAKLAARFEYSRQPCGLVLRVAPRPSRVSVEPLHLVDVEPRQVRITTNLKYRLRGSRAAGLEFHLGDLRFDRLSPEDLLEAPEPIGADGILRVPFRQGVSLPPDLDLKLETHHTLEEGAVQFSVTLPRPLADSVAPATVAVWPADNVELSPQTGLLTGLSPDASPAPPPLVPHQQRPLVYRDLGGTEPAQFGGLLKVKPRAVLVSAAASVRMEQQQLHIEQRLLYRISHEPKRSFVLLAPRGLEAGGSVSVWSGADQLSVQSLTDSTARSASLARLQFSTASDQIGTFPVTVRYALPLPKWDGQKPLPVSIPLVLPEDEPNYQFGGQEIRFDVESGMQVEPELTGLDEFSRPTVSAANAAVFTWPKAAPASRWILQPLRDAPSTQVACEKAWIQTWLTPELRQERAAFRLTSSADALRVRLPSGVPMASVQAAINAQSVAVTPRAPSLLRIELPPAQRGRSCVLELWYSLPPPARHGGLLAEELRPAVLEEAAPPRRSYWQLVLTANDQLLYSSNGMVSEMAYAPSRWFAGPQPLLNQEQLENWMSASRQDPLPAGASAHLFGTLSQSPRLSLVVASRRLTLIVASGLALAVGLLLIYVPALRAPQTLLMTAVVLVGVSLAFPDAALLLGRAALLGLAVTASVILWRWLAWGPPVPTHDPRSTMTAPATPVSSTTQPRPDRSQHPLTTATAPAALAGEPRP